MIALATAALDAHHTSAPWMLGATSLQLARQLAIDEARLVPILAAALAAGRLERHAGYYAVRGFSAALGAEQRAFFDDAVPPETSASAVPVVADDVAAAIKHSTITGLTTAYDMLVATGAIARVGAHLYRAEQLAAIRERLETAIRAGDAVTAAQARDAIGLSRKYVVPLLEYFDAAGVTVRTGDLRSLCA